MAGSGADVDVLVVGAGLAGLAAADRLTQAGLRAVVVERDDEPGGRARSERWEGCTIEHGAVFVLPADRRVRRLIEECPLGDRLTPMPNAFRIAIRRDGRWHHVDMRWPEVELVRYRGIGWREKASLARLLPSRLGVAASVRFGDLASAAAVDSRPLEAVVGPGANRYFASAVAEVFCGYPPEEISLAFGMLGSRYPIRGALLLEDGLGSLTGELGRRVEARCGVAVERVRVEGPDVVAETSDAATLRARAAVLATRAPEALELWPDAPEQTRRFLQDQTYSQGFGVFLRTAAPVRRVDPPGRALYMDVVPRGEGTDALRAVLYVNETAPGVAWSGSPPLNVPPRRFPTMPSSPRGSKPSSPSSIPSCVRRSPPAGGCVGLSSCRPTQRGEPGGWPPSVPNWRRDRYSSQATTCTDR